MQSLEFHLKRQMAFSRSTFGPGERRKGVCDHIRKEIEKEILPETVDANEAAHEFVDLVLLSLDGLWRALIEGGADWDRAAWIACQMIESKQSKNEQRIWPDWRSADPDKAIEHDRSEPETGAARWRG